LALLFLRFFFDAVAKFGYMVGVRRPPFFALDFIGAVALYAFVFTWLYKYMPVVPYTDNTNRSTSQRKQNNSINNANNKNSPRLSI
jgi:hypothetical protein